MKERVLPVDRVIDLMVLIGKKPRTPGEVAKIWGYPKARDRILLWFNRLHDEGLIYICEYEARNKPIYAQQPKPFELPDEPKPVRGRIHSKKVQ